MDRCPFCKQSLPKHTSQCYYGNLPRADILEERAARKKQSEKVGLNKAMIDNTKYVFDNKGNNLKSAKKDEGSV
jgi:hypothetical protein